MLMVHQILHTVIHAVQTYTLDSDGISFISGVALLLAALNSCVNVCYMCMLCTALWTRLGSTNLEQALPCCHACCGELLLVLLQVVRSC